MGLFIKHTDQIWQTQHQPVAEDVEVEAVVEERKKRNGFPLPNLEGLLKMEKLNHSRKFISSHCLSKNSKLLTSSSGLLSKTRFLGKQNWKASYRSMQGHRKVWLYLGAIDPSTTWNRNCIRSCTQEAIANGWY